MAQIEDRYDEERGCGWRKEGGLYMVSGGMSRGCGKLPIPLTVCPCCHAGIKPTRGFTWVTYDLIKNAPCTVVQREHFSGLGTLPVQCSGCHPFNGTVPRFGLLWVGGSFYKTPDAFTDESARLGISRRISAIPREFEIGKDWILLAHRECIHTGNMVPKEGDDEKVTMVPEILAGIFQAFCPIAIEYVVKGTETDEELEAMQKRGLTLVRVIRRGTSLQDEIESDQDFQPDTPSLDTSIHDREMDVD